jgi:hypothetical protein
MDVDEKIHEHNLQLQKEGVIIEKSEKVVFTAKNRLTGKVIEIQLIGDSLTCKNCRDKILTGQQWEQMVLKRVR